MGLEFSDSENALKTELRRFLQKECPTSRVHAVLNGSAGEATRLDSQLAALGYFSAALPEEHDGQGLGPTSLCAIAEELGRALAPTAFGSSLLLAAQAILLGGSEAQRRRYLGPLGQGSLIGTLATAESAGPLTERDVQCVYRAGTLTGTKIAVADGLKASVAIVTARAASGVQVFVVDLSAPGIRRTAQTSMDPTRPIATLRFHGAAAEPLGPDLGWEFVERLLDRAAVMFAFEQLGCADAALERARDYSLERYAFGRPIGSFQAIKHKLADVYIANELARANARYAAETLASDAADLPLAAATARVAACEALERAARENMQTHGGVSATWAHDCHLYYRRARHLATCLGSVQQWRHRQADRLIAHHSVS